MNIHAFGRSEEIDGRTRKGRHWIGKHTKFCHPYDHGFLGEICLYAGQIMDTSLWRFLRDNPTNHLLEKEKN